MNDSKLTPLQREFDLCGACLIAVDWVRNATSITHGWNICPYGAWMAWLVTELWTIDAVTHEVYQKVERACYNPSSTRMKPADRIREVVSAQTIALAWGRMQRDETVE